VRHLHAHNIPMAGRQRAELKLFEMSLNVPSSGIWRILEVLCCTGRESNVGEPLHFGTNPDPEHVKSHKEVTKQNKSRFFLLFLLDGGRCDLRIRIRIREAQNHSDPTDADPDPQHCVRVSFNCRMCVGSYREWGSGDPRIKNLF
jgi:hypothetical protein